MKPVWWQVSDKFLIFGTFQTGCVLLGNVSNEFQTSETIPTCRDWSDMWETFRTNFWLVLCVVDYSSWVVDRLWDGLVHCLPIANLCWPLEHFVETLVTSRCNMGCLVVMKYVNDGHLAGYQLLHWNSPSVMPVITPATMAIWTCDHNTSNNCCFVDVIICHVDACVHTGCGLSQNSISRNVPWTGFCLIGNVPNKLTICWKYIKLEIWVVHWVSVSESSAYGLPRLTRIRGH